MKIVILITNYYFVCIIISFDYSLHYCFAWIIISFELSFPLNYYFVQIIILFANYFFDYILLLHHCVTNYYLLNYYFPYKSLFHNRLLFHSQAIIPQLHIVWQLELFFLFILLIEDVFIFIFVPFLGEPPKIEYLSGITFYLEYSR